MKEYQEFVFNALLDKCPAFVQDLEKQQKGELEDSTLFLWQAFFVNSGYPDLAIEFTELDPNCKDSVLNKLDKFIEESEGNDIKPTRCFRLGCEVHNIENCKHKKVMMNATTGEPSNSPAYHIREEVLKKYEAQAEFVELREEVFERIMSSDKTAHTDEGFIKAAANLKSVDIKAFNKLVEDLSETKVKMTAFNEEVNKLSKGRAREKRAAEVQQIELPDHLKPFGEGTDPNSSYVDENGHIIAMVKEKDGLVPYQASNFVARFKEVREFDDDTEITQQFVIEGLLDGTKELASLTINAKDFRSMN